MNKETTSHLVVLGGASGVVGTICYLIAATVSLDPIVTYVVAMAWPILSIVFLFSLYRFLALESQYASNQLALVFGCLAFTLVAAMLSIQLAVNMGIEEYAAKASQSQQELFGVIRRSIRLVDMGLDVAWDLFMCTALLLLSYPLARHPRFGRWWAVPAAVLGVALIVLNVVTFPWPPDTRGLFDLGPVAGLFIIVLSGRLLLLGTRMNRTAMTA